LIQEELTKKFELLDSKIEDRADRVSRKVDEVEKQTLWKIKDYE